MSDTTQPPPITNDGVACIDCQSDPSDPSDPFASAAAVAAAVPSENLLDPSTFIPPLTATTGLPMPLIVIEYCQRCKFGLRANWIQQELLSTFAPTTTTEEGNQTAAAISCVMLIPKIDEASAGRFRVYILSSNHSKETDEKEAETEKEGLKLVWDRKVEGGFPEMKVLKQKVRDVVNPRFGLGHSDKK